MNVAVRRARDTDFTFQPSEVSSALATRLDYVESSDGSIDLSDKIQEVLKGGDIGIEGLTESDAAPVALTAQQVTIANEVLRTDPALQSLLGVTGTTKLTGEALTAVLVGLPPERRELATSMLAYNIAANQTIDAHAADPYKTFTEAMGGSDLPDMPRSIRKALETGRNGKTGPIDAREAAQLLARKGSTFDAVVKELASSDDPMLRQVARDMIDQSLGLSEDKRAELLGALGLDAPAIREAETARYGAAQSEVIDSAEEIYLALGGPTDLAASEFVATGDGTTTTGLLGKASRGVGLFKYELDASGNAEHRETTTVQPTSDSTSLLLDLKGIDHSGGTVALTVDGHRLELTASRTSPLLHVTGADDFIKSPHPSAPTVDIYRSGDLEIQHDTKSNIFSVSDEGRSPITVELASKQDRGDWDEVTLGVYATQNPNQAPPLDLEVPLTDAYELGSWKLDEEKVDAQFAAGLDSAQKELLREHFADGGALVLDPAGHGIGHLEGGEVVDGASADQRGPNQGARYTGVEAELRRTDSGDFLHVTIDSYTDDVPAQGIKKKLTPEGQVMFDAFLAAHPTSDPNDVLSALRSFAMMEHFTDILVRESGLDPAQAQAALGRSSVRLDDGAEISYADYRRMTGP